MTSESKTVVEGHATSVPLIERLRAVPQDAHLRIDTPNPLGVDSQHFPIGLMCHEAATSLASQCGGEAVAWMDPDTRDVINAERKHEWLTYFGDGGKRKAASYTTPLYASPVPPTEQAVEHGNPQHRAYEAGWVQCAIWAERDDLITDCDSAAYVRERDAALAKLTNPGAEQAGERRETEVPSGVSASWCYQCGEGVVPGVCRRPKGTEQPTECAAFRVKGAGGNDGR